jgi:hypothetical protein
MKSCIFSYRIQNVSILLSDEYMLCYKKNIWVLSQQWWTFLFSTIHCHSILYIYRTWCDNIPEIFNLRIWHSTRRSHMTLLNPSSNYHVGIIKINNLPNCAHSYQCPPPLTHTSHAHKPLLPFIIEKRLCKNQYTSGEVNLRETSISWSVLLTSWQWNFHEFLSLD